MRGMFLVRSEVVQDLLSVFWHPFLLRTSQRIIGCSREIPVCLHQPLWKFQLLYFFSCFTKKALELRSHVNRRTPQAEVCPATRFSPLFVN